MAALGAFVGAVRPHRRENTAFAVLAIAFGVGLLFQWSAASPDEPLLWLWLTPPSLCFLVAAGAAGALGLGFPTPVLANERRLPLVALGIALSYWLVAGAWMVLEFGAFFDSAGYTPDNRPWMIGFNLATVLLLAAFWGLVALWGLRFPGADERRRDQMALAASSLVIWPAFLCGMVSVANDPNGYLRAFGVSAVLPLVLVVAIWVRAARGPKARVAYGVAWIALGSALAGMLNSLALPTVLDAIRSGSLGVARFATVALLAYAILRHQLLGIDVKLRWTISRSTIAAVFIAAFFVTTEGAQQFLGETFRSSYVGILATGALVFAIAPLQRVADRVAAKAVPLVPGPAASASPSTEAVYVQALRIAMRDHVLTSDEEVHLHELADHLGISAGRAMALRLEAAKRASPKRRP